MLRCAAAALVAAAMLPAFAQQRPFPPTALRGELIVTQPPAVMINNQPARLAPGARIRGQNNMLVLSGTVVNQPLLVHYTIDPYGLLLDVWVLTPAERAKQPWPTTPAEAATWRFDPNAQTWSR